MGERNGERAGTIVCDSRKSYVLLAVATIVMITVAFSQFKLICLMPSLMEYWQVEEGLIGILGSSATWIPLVCLIPIGFILRKLPLKWSGGIACICLVVSGLVGAASVSFLMLVIARMVEGLGYMMLVVITQSLVVSVFEKKRATAISILVVGTMVGEFIFLNVGSRLLNVMDWRGLYVVIAVVQAIAGIAWVLLVNKNVQMQNSGQPEGQPDKNKKGEALRNPGLWLICIAFMFFAICTIIFSNYIPTYFISRGMDSVRANTLYSVSSIIGIFSILGAGVLADKLKTKRKIAIAAFFASVVTFGLLGVLPLNMMVIFIILFGITPRPIMSLTMSSIGDLYDDKGCIPVASSFQQTCNSLATTFGGILIGYLIQLAGYNATIIAVMVMMGVGGVLWIFARRVS